MSRNQKILLASGGSLVVLLVCCVGILIGRSQMGQDQASPVAAVGETARPATPANTVIITAPPPTAAHTAIPIIVVVTTTPVPATDVTPATPAPPPSTATPVPTLPPAPPPASSLEDLVAYAEVVQPILEAGLVAAERDGAILEVSKEDENALCGEGLNPHPTLLADAALMDDLVRQLDAIAPPAGAADSVHKPLRDSAQLWGDALDNINLSCQTADAVGRGLLRAGAVLQVAGAAINFRIAADNFVLLLVANGLEELANQLQPRP